MTGRYVGARVLRVEDPRFLAGRGALPRRHRAAGMLHVAFVRSPFAHARIGSVDCCAGAALDGRRAVVTARTCATRRRSSTRRDPARGEDGHRPLLPRDRVRFVGEPVAAVVAARRYVAEDAAELVDVEYEPLPAVLDAEAALAPGAPVLHDELGDNNFAHIEFEAGDVDAAFAGAAHVFRKRFHFGRTHAAPLEGRGVIADWDAAEGS